MHVRRIGVVGIAVLVVIGFVSPLAAAGTVGTTGTTGTTGAAGAGPASTADATEPTCSFPVTVTDDTDTEIELESPPDSVVTLNPSAAQTMWEIGAEDQVVGTTQHAENLEGAEDRTSVSTESETIEHEIIVDLDPDLVLAPSSDYVSEDEEVETLREADVPVYYFDSAESIDDVRDRTHTIGSLVGECDGAAETVDWMDEELAIVEDALEGEERPDVLYTFFGFTAGEETFIHELIEAGGGTNVAAEAGITEYQQPTDEMILEQDPEWLILNTNSPDVPDAPAYDSTTAVEQNQTVTIEVNHLNRPGPRVVHAVTAMAETFHPEAYAEAVSDAETESETVADADNETETEADSDSTDDSDGIPGFGILPAGAALAALLTLLAVIRHGDRNL
ncbi:ABC-type transport system periplasmic substrate-binding protein (probable substrate iron/cobalamin) [Natrialba magadii ATCC 43099]|uniref:ABC-type transport system periplasmic substrate-binding protein (Probable substrate iron/cobalamin) n=1 Tax=Natrialba magadii (strain ATCC 43099 / DSM 3394 / CCM 3739 / CIP 104546 / IAM 13178 / JCM 8861 / NBRC 102185 / NCIMB 2190 / MS3) TaxID=547559 RepID=D3SV03_NATMM|nr:PGF-CTERM-anchored ABC transporter substrate-binding protein [Natrialba magadii]ADD05411.1 ABC-type transport system periplasmic substrate-binding protein (probable substrate iron/cobalamin) [Natrialba magadii ATCC 43099]ELY29276.1 periplasmic binding protein [Natrialba magadii ATCC 43099]